MVHKDVFPFSCEKCGSKFKWRSGLSQHRRNQKQKCELLQKSQESEDDQNGPEVEEITIEDVAVDELHDLVESEEEEESIDESEEHIAPSKLKRKRSTSKSKKKSYN